MLSLRSLLLLLIIIPLFSEYCEKTLSNNETSLFVQDCQTFHQIHLNIGTPPKSFPFLIDTGSVMSWLPTAGCKCGSGIDTFKSKSSNISIKAHNIKVI